MSQALHAFSQLLRVNDLRLQDQQERTARSRASSAPQLPPASHIVPAAPYGVRDHRFEALFDALDEADTLCDSSDAIVHLERFWFEDASSAMDTQRKQFGRAMESLLAGNVRSLMRQNTFVAVAHAY